VPAAALLAFMAITLLMAMSSCTLTRPALQEDQVAGIYQAVTDFSRDVQNMNGAKETMIYKKGREEKLKFINNHTFIKTIHYSSERVADQIVMGNWELTDNHIIHAFGKEGTGAFSEYYQMEGNPGKLIRLDENKHKLSPEYAPFFTYYRVNPASTATGVK